MPDDIMIDAVAAALAAGSGDGLTDLGRAALARLKRSVYIRRSVDTATAAALANAHAQPSSGQKLRDLCAALTDAMADAPALADDVRLLWRHMKKPEPAAPGGGEPKNLAATVKRPTIPTISVRSGIAGRDRGPVGPNPGA